MERSYFFLIVVCLFTLFIGIPANGQDAGDTSPESEEEVPLQFQLGHNAYNNGDLNEARTRLKRSVQSDTIDPRARYWLGKTYFELGMNDSAVRTLRNHEPRSRLQRWFERELRSHEVRYDSPNFSFRREWSYVGLIDGDKYGRERHITPSAITSAPDGGWYSSSFKMGKLSLFSEEGKQLQTWTNFKKPTDVAVHPTLGVIVSELETGTIRRLTDTGTIVPFSSDLKTPTEILRVGKSLFVFESARGSITQLSLEGDTSGYVWEARPGVQPVDVSIGPNNHFWIIDRNDNNLIVVDRNGEEVANHSFDRNLNLNAIWWRRGHLLGVSNDGIFELNRSDFTPDFFSAQGDTLPGDDVSGILFSGDRMIVSTFEGSSFLIYRPTNISEPDVLVQERRMEFRDFPILRLNVMLDDPLRSRRLEHLGDGEFGLGINNIDMSPSFFRHSTDVYGRNWILIVDNRMDSTRAWEEVLPFLESMIDKQPEGAEGSIWQTQGENTVAQQYTKYPTLLKNALNRLNLISPESASDENRTSLKTALNQAYNVLFSRRDPGGVILLSNHVKDAQGLHRIANRSTNTRFPLVVLRPTSDRLPPNHALRDHPGVNIQNFRNFKVNNIWDHYRRNLRHHYTAITRSNLQYQPSSMWREYQLRFYHLDRTVRYNSGFLFQ